MRLGTGSDGRVLGRPSQDSREPPGGLASSLPVAKALVAFAFAMATVLLVMRGEHRPALLTALAAVVIGYVASRGRQSVVGGVLGTLAILAGGGYIVLVVIIVFGAACRVIVSRPPASARSRGERRARSP